MDSARTYTGGTSEEYLGNIDWKKRGLVMDTKLYPNAVRVFSILAVPYVPSTVKVPLSAQKGAYTPPF